MLSLNARTGGARRLTVQMLVLTLLALAFVVPVTAAPVHSIADTSAVSPDQRAVLCALESSFSAMAQQAEPGVVSITAIQYQNAKSAGSVHSATPWPSTSLNRQPSARETGPMIASGSGAIVRRQGPVFYILTNFHVVEDAYTVSVRLSDNSQTKGTVVGVDPVTDLAVVSVSSPSLSDDNVLPMGDSSDVKVGAWALALGSPYGLDRTLTVGIISALHRELEQDDDVYPDLIQTDAAINKGSSGGPLLNIDGQIIGINAVIASPTGTFIGLGFAIPINTAKTVLDQLIRTGRVVRGWIGMSIQELTPVLQQFYGAKTGVLVSSVDNGGPAARSGLRSEDIVATIGETGITDVGQFQRAVTGAQPGSSVKLGVYRDGKPLWISVPVGISPATPTGRPSPPRPGKTEIGMKVMAITGEMAASLGLRSTKGALVVDVTPGSPAEGSGLEPGDVVHGVNGLAISTEAQFKQVVKQMGPGSIVVLRIQRKDESRIVGFRWE